jgi:cysteinyl-tRNA synthetase
MSSKLLGTDFDIHGGGSDLIFPHHENECAQSTCAFKGSKFAHYWVHAGMLMVDGVKMSKSLGNFYNVDEIISKYPAESLRLLFLTTHYHQPFNFTFAGLEQAKAVLDKFYNALRQTADLPDIEAKPNERVVDALADDLNTPAALSVLHELVNGLNKAENSDEKARLKAEFKASADMLGLLYQTPEQWFKGQDTQDQDEIEQLIAARAEAKKAKDWAKADAIRNALKEKGIVLEDTANGTIWKRA